MTVSLRFDSGLQRNIQIEMWSAWCPPRHIFPI